MSKSPEANSNAVVPNFELLKLQLEQTRHRTEIVKWVIVAVGAVVSFWVVDYGKLRLEQFRVTSDSQRQMLQAYLTATEAAQPEVWKRKLHVIQNFADDQTIKTWAQAELQYIETFSAVDALYRETIKIASQLVEPVNSPERATARSRFNQLYWADLPYVGESRDVEQAMVEFRKALIAAEDAPQDKSAWQMLNNELYDLSRVLRNATPPYPSNRPK
jgi:hypothetical protein